MDLEGYAITDIGRRKIGMHRMILGIVDNMDIDHLDRNPLNNRRNNIRFCTHQDNMKNKFYKKNKYGCPGVVFTKNMNKYHAYIGVDKKQINLGFYSKLEDAIKVRREAEKKYFSEYRILKIEKGDKYE